jgi:hypothetical protein
VDRLQIEHGKFMHVIGVSDDLEDFFHIHPERASPGMWQVTHTFARPGTYKIWSDLKYRGTSYSFSHPLLSIVGGPRLKPEVMTLEDSQTASGCQVCFQHPDTFTVARTNQFQFVIRDAAGNPLDTENFLGSPMHLIIVKDDLSVYLHAHPESRREGGGPITFRQSFNKPGEYRLFAQFRPWHSKLPPEDAILAKFQVRVETAETLAR